MFKFFQILDLGIAAVNKNIAVIGIAAGTLLAFINVVLRYCFNSGFSWAGEATNYLFIWSAFFGAAYGFNRGIHVSVTILIEKIHPLIAKTCFIFSSVVSTAFLLFLAYYGFEYLLVLHELEFMSVDLGVPQWVPMLVLPIAFFLAAYRSGEKIIQVAKTPAKTIGKAEVEELVSEAVQRD